MDVNTSGDLEDAKDDQDPAAGVSRCKLIFLHNVQLVKGEPL